MLAPYLTKLFNHILESNHFPDEMLLANLSLILKPLKDHTLPQHFCPILVLNNDLKIFGRLLADRIAAVATTLIHTGQIGFIPGRQIVDNIRLVTNDIQDAILHSHQICLLGLDIHKAFDSVNWSYLNHLLPKFSISDKFIQGFSALSHSPQTRIKIPGNNSDFFPLSRGTRQGCPLSPLLFVLAIEPLAQAMRNNVNIKGYFKTHSEFKLGLYLDDALLFLTDPLISIPNLLDELNIFYNLSGLKIDINKCSALPINFSHNMQNLLQKNSHLYGVPTLSNIYVSTNYYKKTTIPHSSPI